MRNIIFGDYLFLVCKWLTVYYNLGVANKMINFE